tara:strand:- start:881 stop:1048 length:168 start_codon:yes stop_codon:yes gene_type:complete
MVSADQKLLSQLYELQDALEILLSEHQMYEELDLLSKIIDKLEYNIINSVGSMGI